MGPNRVAGHPDARMKPTQHLLDDATPEIFITTMTNEGYICLRRRVGVGLGRCEGGAVVLGGANVRPRVNWSES